MEICNTSQAMIKSIKSNIKGTNERPTHAVRTRHRLQVVHQVAALVAQRTKVRRASAALEKQQEVKGLEGREAAAAVVARSSGPGGEGESNSSSKKAWK